MILLKRESRPLRLVRIGDSMSTASVDNELEISGTRKLRSKRIDITGKKMRRVVLMLTDEDWGRVNTAITCLSLSLFSKLFDGAKIDTTGPEDEVRGRAIAKICDCWISGFENAEK